MIAETDTVDPRFVARLGLAIARPRWALTVGGDRRFAGRSGSDFIVVIVLLLAATQLRLLFASVWHGYDAGSFGVALRGVMHVLTRTLTLDLGFLVLGALLVWILAGAKRNLGRAFDLACVASLPLLLVDLGATTIVRAFDGEVPFEVAAGLAVSSWAWTGVLLALAVRPARIASTRMPAPPRAVVAIAKRVGWGALAVVALGIVIQTRWIAEHLEDLRPVSSNNPAPAFALRTVGPGGVLGPVRTLADSRGKVTIVDFWATWCGPCLKAMPELDKLAREPGVEVLAVNLDNAEAARAMFDQHGWAMTLLSDDGEVSERYGVLSIPHTVLLDRDGTVRAVSRGTGMAEIETLVEQIRK